MSKLTTQFQPLLTVTKFYPLEYTTTTSDDVEDQLN